MVVRGFFRVAELQSNFGCIVSSVTLAFMVGYTPKPVPIIQAPTQDLPPFHVWLPGNLTELKTLHFRRLLLHNPFKYSI